MRSETNRSWKLLINTRIRTRNSHRAATHAHYLSDEREQRRSSAMADVPADGDSCLEMTEPAPSPEPEPELEPTLVPEKSAKPEWSREALPVSHVSVSRVPSGARPARSFQTLALQIENAEAIAVGSERALHPTPAHANTARTPTSASLLSLPLFERAALHTFEDCPYSSRPAACASSWLAQRLAQRAGVAYREQLSVPFYRFERSSTSCSSGSSALVHPRGSATAALLAVASTASALPHVGFADPHVARERFPSRPLNSSVSARLERFLGAGSRMLRSYAQRGALRRVLRTSVPTCGEMKLLGTQMEEVKLQKALLSPSSTPVVLEPLRMPALVLTGSGHSEPPSHASRSASPSLSVLLRGRQPPAAQRIPRPRLRELKRTNTAPLTDA